MEDVILEARGLSYAYDGAAHALDGVSMEIRRGEKIAVLGTNGAGKSTFFLCLNGVLEPHGGEVLLQGAPVTRKTRNDLRQRVGVVFQNADDQIIASTVRAEISFGPMNLRLPKEEVVRRTEQAMDYMYLQDYRDRPPHALSGGEKKRVTIADILAMESEVILFDEPAASLDPAGAAALETVLARLHDAGKTLLISTHDMDFAYRWADRVVVFCAGKICADGAPAEIFSDRALLAQASLRQPTLLAVWNALRARGLAPAQGDYPRTPEALEGRLDAFLRT